MEIIKFNDFMSKKHKIEALTEQEEMIWSTFKHTLFIFVLLMILGVSTSIGLPMPIGGENIHAFLQFK